MKEITGTTTSTTFASIGNKAHTVNLILAITFAMMVVLYGSSNDDDIFDTDWKRNGFCTTNFDKPYINSHDACFYFDTIMSIVLGIMYIYVKDTPGLENVNKYIIPNMIGIFVHGLGHEAVAVNIRSSGYDINAAIEESNRAINERYDDGNIQKFITEEIIFLIFWLGLLYAAMNDTKKIIISIIAILSRLGQRHVPPLFAFTYVQTILVIAFSFNQLSLNKKEKNNTFGYALQPLLVAIPTTVIGYMESTQCQSFVKDKLYGHLIYDGYVAVSVCLWYGLCYLHARDENDYNNNIVMTKKKIA